jgi:hypothetical protein
MQHAFNELLHFLQQGISAIFHFVQMIWAWSVGQISALLAMATMADLEADLIGVSARGRDLGAIQSCDRTVCSWGTDHPNRIRAFTYRSRTHVAKHRICRVDCS